MHKLKSIVQRGTMFGAVGALLVATVVPASPAFADALNPLTERSLLLSSSAPGYQNTDGSGNATYAPPDSGPNGEKTGETFTFKVSSAATVKGFSFQYCTTAAGLCKAPGNNDGDARTLPTPDRDANIFPRATGDEEESDLNVVGTFTQAPVSTAPTAGQFQIYQDNSPTASPGWTMTARNAEDNAWVDLGTPDQDGLTGKNNYITISNATGIALDANDEIKVVFRASGDEYITNPGYGSFFVKINTYNTENEATQYTDTVPLSETNPYVIDGGVTVANVMTDSIHIVTKVLETMAFSVGIQNPDTVNRAGATEHGRCEPISQDSTITSLTDNRLNLGNPNAEYSLETGRAWDVNSYWRLSSNSSGGATVYYSGNTLANTSGDEIADMQSEQLSNPGTEQFGLGFVDAGLDNFSIGDDTFQSGWVTPRSFPFITVAGQGAGAPYNALAAQATSTGYDEATGRINVGNDPGTEPIEAKFQFHKSSLDVPVAIAQQDETVISCATAKMRYIGNIGADTPAGVYTTKINYLAAPQY